MATLAGARRAACRRACGSASGCAHGDRVAIVAKNSPDYLELMFGIWHAGPRRRAGQRQAARARARLHPGAFRRAGVLRLRRAGRRASRRTRRQASSGSIRVGSVEYETLCQGRSDRRGAARARRPRLAVLHLRHDRPPEGRDADASRSVVGEPRLRDRGRSGRARRSGPACGADEPRLRASTSCRMSRGSAST